MCRVNLKSTFDSVQISLHMLLPRSLGFDFDNGMLAVNGEQPKLKTLLVVGQVPPQLKLAAVFSPRTYLQVPACYA